MKLTIVAGTPGAGKTSILIHALKAMVGRGLKVCVVKFDCLYTEDDKRFAKLGIPYFVSLSMDMCPDHYTIYNTDDTIKWAEKQGSDILVVETAGLCHRCAPYTTDCLGVCVIDATCGPNTPLKVGPFLSTANVVAVTKGDIISQAEREIFRERIIEVNSKAIIIDANGLSGQGGAELSEEMEKSGEISLEKEQLRHSAPFSICTLCVGEKRVNKKYHRGILRKLDGSLTYEGE